jgi:RNA polymerase sigma-70 factor (ECF subfamily)
MEVPEAERVVRALYDRCGLALFGSGCRRRSSQLAEVLIATREFEVDADETDRNSAGSEGCRVESQAESRTLSGDRRLFLCWLTACEAARRLGIPIGIVTSRSHYALHALRAAVE